MALLDQYNLAMNGEFQAKVLIAVCAKARTVLDETLEADHIDTQMQLNTRQALARVVLGDPERVRTRMALVVAANPQVTAASPDPDIEWTVGDAWDDLSGVSVQDKTA